MRTFILASGISFALVASLLAGGLPASAASPATIELGSFQAAPDGSGDITSDITVSSPDQAVSAVVLRLSYTNLKYVDTTFVNSVFPTELVDAQERSGEANFSRLRLDTGYRGIHGLIGQITFEPLNSGQASLSVDRAGSSLTSYQGAIDILGNAAAVSGAVSAPVRPSAAASPKGLPTTMTVSEDESGGMDMGTRHSSGWSWPENALGWLRYGLAGAGTALLIASGVSWLRSRRPLSRPIRPNPLV